MLAHITDGTLLVFLGVFLVAFERIGLATLAGGIGVCILLLR